MKHPRSAFIVCLAIIYVSGNVRAQMPIVDSLKKIAATVKKDSAAKLYVKIANIFTGVNSDSVRKYARIASLMADPKSSVKGDVFVQLGNSYHMENKMDSALNYYKKALVYFQKTNNDKGIGIVYQSFALVKNSVGDFSGAIDDSKKAAAIFKKINSPAGVTNIYNNIASSYVKLNNYAEAITYAKMAFSNSKLLNDSLKYYTMMSSYGSKLCHSSKVDSAIYYINTSSRFFEKNSMYNLLIAPYSNLAMALDLKGPAFRKAAKAALLKAKGYALLSGAKDNLKFLYKDLALVYLGEKNYDSTGYYFLQTLSIIDTLAQQDAMHLTQEMELKYETEKKELQIENQSLEINAKEKQNKQKSLIILLGALALAGSGFFGIMAFVSFRKTKKANVVIETQKAEVEYKNEEITRQKELVDIKQREIIDSINYAKRIQQAVLTGEDVWNKISKEHFIVFKPKDIVSGDFYWAYNTPNGRSVFALADCTGHGVPGGFMSMLGNSFLNEIVVENKIFKAGEILNKLRSKIISALEQKGMTEQKDGMDICLCVWNKMDNTLEFAGANNALWLLRDKQMIEYKADKMPIGTYLETELPFNNTVISLQKGDILYLCTDGYADQFGGEKGKKLKHKAFIDLLSRTSDKDMVSQKEILEKTFETWKGSYEQIDDVSVIGIKVMQGYCKN